LTEPTGRRGTASFFAARNVKLIEISGMGGAAWIVGCPVRSAPTEDVRFARDSPLEGDGFEPSVPGERAYGFEAVGTIGFV
jgi:hypothetical protein